MKRMRNNRASAVWPSVNRHVRSGSLLLGLLLVARLALGATNEVQYLSGTDKDHTASWEFRVSAGRNSGFWTNIPVPSCWDTKGFGSYEYGNDSTSEVGEYRHRFTVPDRWANQRVFLVFEGVMTDAEVKLNGQSPGAIHQGGFYEFSYEVTSNLLFGASNRLEVTVRKKSANTSINQAERQADYWTFGGIYRPVYIAARPQEFIERIATDVRADGQIAVHAFFSGLANNYTVAAQVTASDGTPLGGEFTTPVSAGASNVILSAALPAPQLWSPEFPNLYKLTIQLRDGAKLIHSLTETIGFRTVAFTNSVGFFLNGKKVLLRGVNRHEFWPTDGRTSSRAQSIADIQLIKSMNMNAVRMSHYPPAKHFLEECDRLGLLVLDELAGWQAPSYDNQIAPGLVREMVVRDVNHPCIFAWANGNEGGSNPTVDDDFGLWDPQQRTVLHPANWESEITGGLRTHHYATYRQVTNYLGAGKPVFMPTEIQHGLYDGGGGAGLADHWNAMRAAPNSGGMFIWSLLDEGLVRDDQGGAIDVAGDNAPDGIFGPYREKEASYYAVKALWSPVQITPPQLATFDGTLTIENRFDFTDLSQCMFRWQLGSFPDPGTPADGLDFVANVSSPKFAGPAVAPGASGALALNLPETWHNHDALRLTAEDPSGREIYTWTWPLRSAAQVRDRIVNRVRPKPAAITVGVNTGELSVTNGPRVWRFDLGTGRLNGVTVIGQPVALANGPRPVVGEWRTSRVTHSFDGADYVVTMNDATNASDGFEWRIRTNGWLNLHYRYTLTGTQPWLGVTFDYPETRVTAMRWLGQGPYRVWKNRLAGQEVAVHRKTANQTDTGKQWDYPEFPGYHGQLYWAALETTEASITLATATPDLFFRVLTPPVASVSRPGVSPEFPAGNLSFLHAINAIGNKFATPDPSLTGPASAPNLATGLYTGAVDFYIDALPVRASNR